jgi:hypothetical protein
MGIRGSNHDHPALRKKITRDFGNAINNALAHLGGVFGYPSAGLNGDFSGVKFHSILIGPRPEETPRLGASSGILLRRSGEPYFLSFPG